MLVSAGNPIPLDIMQQAVSSRGAEIEAETKSGATRIIGFNLTALKNDSGEVIGKTMVFRDITDIKNMEEKLKEKKRLEAIGELASIMAHELKNPLAAICGSMEVLRESKDFTTKKLSS